MDVFLENFEMRQYLSVVLPIKDANIDLKLPLFCFFCDDGCRQAFIWNGKSLN